jgi:methylmalonyl-CoA mutase cobalamin-binding subunit
MSEQMMLQRAAEARFDVIGISIHNAEGEGRATALVAALRAASMERGVRILLGGSQFKDRPEAVLALGSDLPVLSFAALRVALDHSKPTVFV